MAPWSLKSVAPSDHSRGCGFSVAGGTARRLCPLTQPPTAFCTVRPRALR